MSLLRRLLAATIALASAALIVPPGPCLAGGPRNLELHSWTSDWEGLTGLDGQYWVGDDRQINWSSEGGGSEIHSGGGLYRIASELPRPITLIDPLHELESSSTAYVAAGGQSVFAEKSDILNVETLPSGLDETWPHYARVFDREGILLASAETFSKFKSQASDSAFHVEQQIATASWVSQFVDSSSATQAKATSRAVAHYLVAEPVRFSLSTGLSRLGEVSGEILVKDDSTGEVFFRQSLDQTLDGTTSHSSLSGEFWPGMYTVEFRSSVLQRSSLSGTSTQGGQAYLQLDFTSHGLTAADFNGDNSVAWNDLSVWDAAYGSSRNGDLDGDGSLSSGDLNVWRQYKASSPDWNADGVITDSDFYAMIGQVVAGDADLDQRVDGSEFSHLATNSGN